MCKMPHACCAGVGRTSTAWTEDSQGYVVSRSETSADRFSCEAAIVVLSTEEDELEESRSRDVI